MADQIPLTDNGALLIPDNADTTTTAEDTIVPITIENFIQQLNSQMKTLKDEATYAHRCFKVMYKYKIAVDLIVEKYFQADDYFKFKNMMDDLDADLVAFISEDEARYRTMADGVDTDVLLMEDDQIVFTSSAAAVAYQLDEEEDRQSNRKLPTGCLQLPDGSTVTLAMDIVNNGSLDVGSLKTYSTIPSVAPGPTPDFITQAVATTSSAPESPKPVHDDSGCLMPFSDFPSTSEIDMKNIFDKAIASIDVPDDAYSIATFDIDLDDDDDDDTEQQCNDEEMVEQKQDMDISPTESTTAKFVICDINSMITDECDLCSLKFLTPGEMLNHLKDIHRQCSIRGYFCNFERCSYATYFRSALGKHKNGVHGGKYRCEVCGKLSKDSGNHNRHLNIHKKVVYRCHHEGCKAAYKSPKAYAVHVLKHSQPKPIFKCARANCNFETFYTSALKTHQLSHSEARPFPCPFEESCQKSFKRNGDLNKHIMYTHKGYKRSTKKGRSQKVLYRCQQCPFTAEDEVIIGAHEAEHALLGNSIVEISIVDAPMEIIIDSEVPTIFNDPTIAEMIHLL